MTRLPMGWTFGRAPTCNECDGGGWQLTPPDDWWRQQHAIRTLRLRHPRRARRWDQYGKAIVCLCPRHRGLLYWALSLYEEMLMEKCSWPFSSD